MQWKQKATCLEDSSTGEYCNNIFQESGSSGIESSMQCSDCTLDYLTTLANSQWGQKLLNPAVVESRIVSCSATVLYTVAATSTSASASVSTTASSMTNTRCNTTSPYVQLYTIKANQSCTDISLAQSVSTATLQAITTLDTVCNYLQANQTLCLPSQCAIHKVNINETCTSIVDTLDHTMSIATFRSWNPSINVDCSNIDAFFGDYLCVSPPGTLSIPDTFPLAAATTAVPVPNNVVTTFNTNCGHWYKIQTGGGCEAAEDMFDISSKDFYFLNLQLNNSCEHLWCVQPVGNINTYSEYSTKSAYTTLANTMNLNVTRTVNRTTTHFFYSYPSITTTTVTPNATNYQFTQNYTLCEQVLTYYNIPSANELNEYIADDPNWYSEYERVCVLNLNSALPTVPSNTSIVISTYAPASSSVFSSSIGATPGTTSTVTVAPSTVSSSATTPSATSNISTNGLCGSDNNGYVCTGSEFGNCCSNYGYCKSTSEYCSSANCDSAYGTCS